MRLRLRPSATAAWLVMAMLTAACTPTSDNANGGLVNTTWTVISINGIATIPTRPTLVFASDGSVSGTSSCNGYTGSFRTDGERITIRQLSTTLMGCEAGPMAQEAAFNSGLSGATNWRLTPEGNLELGGGAAAIVAGPGVAEGPPAADPGAGLAGTRWSLAELGNTADLAGIVPTIEFGADGAVSGFAGCNTFGGTYTTDGDKLTMGPLASTKIGCERPASAVETEVFAALSGVTTWSIGADGRLVLGGHIPLTFAPG